MSWCTSWKCHTGLPVERSTATIDAENRLSPARFSPRMSGAAFPTLRYTSPKSASMAGGFHTAPPTDDDQIAATEMHELRSRIDGDLIVEISHRVLPQNFACFRIQGHDGIVKPANEHRAVSKSHAMVVPATAEKELRELRLVVESVKLPKHPSG